MNNLPLVTIGIPTYNGEKYLEECLQSALQQTYSNLEILISDDGSADNTLAIIAKYQQQHSHIRLVKNTSPGMVNNWNNCIEQAAGEWIKFLFQDDVLQPSCVERMLTTCVEHSVEVGLCRRRFIIHDDVPRYMRHNIRYTMVVPERIFDDTVYVSPERLAKELAELLPDNVLGEPTCYLVNKKIFEQTGMFNPEYKHAVDLEFITRLGLIKGLVFISDPLVSFRVHTGSETSGNLNEGKESALRNIAAQSGDTILLYYKILHNPSFRLIKEAMGEDLLRLRINYLYHSGCKHRGAKLFNQALAPLRKKYKELGELNYSFFKYIHYRKQFRKWVKHNRA
jgi:glycosyltransferase involved in cell wall biosynthesis